MYAFRFLLIKLYNLIKMTFLTYWAIKYFAPDLLWMAGGLFYFIRVVMQNYVEYTEKRKMVNLSLKCTVFRIVLLLRSLG